MKNLPAVPKPANPELFDKPIGEIQTILKAELPWLNYAFGEAQTLVRVKDKAKFAYPGVHIRNAEYEPVLPDQKLGNFSFFVLDSSQNLDFDKHTTSLLKVRYGLVFWFNLDSVFADDPDRRINKIEADILKVLIRKNFLKTGRITVDRIQTKAEAIFKGYDLKELDSQYLMQPFAGLRFEGELLFRETNV